MCIRDRLYVIQKAKEQGCPAFRSNRVYEGELLEWLEEHPYKKPLGVPAVDSPFHGAAAVSYTHLDVYKRQDLKPKSLEARITGLRKLRKTWPELETLKPRSVTPAGIAEWATTFKNGLAGNSATSVNGAIDTLRRLMDIAVARGAIHANPVAVRPEDGEGRLKKKRTPKKLTLPSMANTHRLFVAIENSGNLGGW